MVVTLDVHDPAWVKEYMEKVPDIYEAYGGKRFASSGPVSVVEGDAPAPETMILFSFPTEKDIHDFLADPAYTPWKQQRLNGAKTTIWTFENRLRPDQR
jgi:uncharacterized protein (DUF1330 family)